MTPNDDPIDILSICEYNYWRFEDDQIFCIIRSTDSISWKSVPKQILRIA